MIELKKISKIHLHVEGAGGARDLLVRLDEEVINLALLDNDRLVNPGPHTVVVTATGFQPAQLNVLLREGEAQPVSIALQRTPGYVTPMVEAPLVAPAPPPPAAMIAPPMQGPPVAPVQPAPPPAAVQPMVAPPPAAAQSNQAPAYVSFGLGGAGLVVGSIFGAMALSNKSSLDGTCPAKACPASSQSDIDALHTNAIVSTAGFGVGALGLGLGTYFLLSSSGAEHVSGRPAAVLVRPWVSPTSVGFAGEF